MTLPILYQDRDLIVVNKPSGLLVHRSTVDRHETEFALQTLRDQVGMHVYPVHRLDKPTSGALIFAFSSEVARALSENFAQGQVAKRYLAVVRGVPQIENQLIDYPLKEELDRHSDRKARVDKPAQNAQTWVRRLASHEFAIAVDRYPTSRYSLVEARPCTGRKHQIRRHLRHLGHPVIGDVNHGVGKHNRFFLEQFKLRRLLLACCELRFAHPVSRVALCIQAPLEGDFANLLRELKWETHLV